MEFSWSGNFLGKNLNIASDRFSRWAQQSGNANYLNKVISHSYGADVVGRAIVAGVRVKESVFLSAPVTHHVQESCRYVSKVVDIRLAFDLILWAAGERQRLPSERRITKVVLWVGPWKHDITHNVDKWVQENIASNF